MSSKITFTLFGMPNCPDCIRAKDLLKSSGYEFETRGEGEGEVPFTPEELIALVGPVRTLPQIVVHLNGASYHVGGYRDLAQWYPAGVVDNLRKIS